jgi:hypothetical protein
MTQFNAPARRGGGELDVYTALAAVACLVLLAGVIIMAVMNTSFSDTGSGGGPIKLIDKPRR